jgi:negative regulator of replication initiation
MGGGEVRGGEVGGDETGHDEAGDDKTGDRARWDGFRRVEIDVAVHRAIERGRHALGESENDILRRLLLGTGRRADGGRGAPAGGAARAPGQVRSRGLWTVEIGGRRIAAANLKQAYRRLLLELDAAHPQFLEAFAVEKGRTRHFVARTPAALYGSAAHLAGRHAEPLASGWYFDTNLSAAQVAKRARIAARLCGLLYGQDVRILDNLREI